MAYSKFLWQQEVFTVLYIYQHFKVTLLDGRMSIWCCQVVDQIIYSLYCCQWLVTMVIIIRYTVANWSAQYGQLTCCWIVLVIPYCHGYTILSWLYHIVMVIPYCHGYTIFITFSCPWKQWNISCVKCVQLHNDNYWFHVSIMGGSAWIEIL